MHIQIKFFGIIVLLLLNFCYKIILDINILIKIELDQD